MSPFPLLLAGFIFPKICPGSGDNGYSLQAAKWTQNETKSGMDFFCEKCPQPASSVECLGGTMVRSQEGWWLVKGWWLVRGEERIRPATIEEERAGSRRDNSEIKNLFVTYKCDPGVCLGNNECANDRTGVACGGCPDNHVLTVGQCTECPEHSPEVLFMWRVIFCLACGVVVFTAWFILCWAPFFGGTAQEYFMKYFGWYELLV